jgi:hypothetical protein
MQGKAARAWGWPLPSSSIELWDEWSYAQLPHMASSRAQRKLLPYSSIFQYLPSYYRKHAISNYLQDTRRSSNHLETVVRYIDCNFPWDCAFSSGVLQHGIKKTLDRLSNGILWKKICLVCRVCNFWVMLVRTPPNINFRRLYFVPKRSSLSTRNTIFTKSLNVNSIKWKMKVYSKVKQTLYS